MNRKQFINTLGSFAVFSIFAGCKKDWLDREPHTIILDEQVWNDPQEILGILANLYGRLTTDTGLVTGDNVANWFNATDYMDAMWSGQSNEDWRNNLPNYGFDYWRLWIYGYIRDVNLALEGLKTKSKELDDSQIEQFNAEFRFLRAYQYFELVKRMGGVPLVTEVLDYDFSGDPTPLQVPRSKEHEIYDFIASEVDEIKEKLGNEGSNTRANKYTALALKSRALLYAASIAKFNNELSNPITTSGGEVGIPASMAEDYYENSLAASTEIITKGGYELYANNPDLGENFYEAVTTKSANNEVLFARDHSAKNKHFFSYDNIARGIREDNLGSSSITPSLNLVESYPYLDGSEGKLKLRTPDGSDYIYYDNLEEVFANKDARLYGTVIYPGTSFKGENIEIQAGVKEWDSSINDYNTVEGAQLGSTFKDGKILTGTSGPQRSGQNVSNTGFYLRKYIDSTPLSSSRGVQSQMWWVWFRLGEIHLNAAEAAFELNRKGDAAGFLNPLRERAGYGSNSLDGSTITRDIVRNEFRCELAFEDHHLWDLRRWRTAHLKWTGSKSNEDDMVYALYPYRVVKPGDAARDGKYVFDKFVAPRFIAARYFRMGNYYSSIAQSVRNNNPKIVKNPFH